MKAKFGYPVYCPNACVPEAHPTLATLAKIYFTPKGKAIYEGKNGIQIVQDIEGGYFRILDTKRRGAHIYLDLNGDVPSNKINERGKQQGRTKAEYNEVTHFKVK